jgi:hypothetical protein
MSELQAEKETVAQMNLKRTGQCVAVTCRAKCEVFLFDEVRDGFRTCTCEHTQVAHAYPEGVR